MPAETITVLSHTVDPLGIPKVLRTLSSNVVLNGYENDWRSVTIATPRRLFRASPGLTFFHNRERYKGPGWRDELEAIKGHVGRFPLTDRTGAVLRLIESLRFALSVVPTPEMYLDSDDERRAWLFAVVEHLDGVILTPSGLRDARGRVLIHATRNPDPRAVMPRSSANDTVHR